MSDFGNYGWYLSGGMLHKSACRVKPIWEVILSEDWMKFAQRKGQSLFRVWRKIFLCNTLTPVPRPSPSLRPLEESNHLCLYFHKCHFSQHGDWGHLFYIIEMILLFYFKRIFLYWASKEFSVIIILLDCACKALMVLSINLWKDLFWGEKF